MGHFSSQPPSEDTSELPQPLPPPCPKPCPTYNQGLNRSQLKLDDPGADILNVMAALVQMCDMQAEVHTGNDKRLAGEFKKLSLIEQ